jgi:hypothetical protein
MVYGNIVECSSLYECSELLERRMNTKQGVLVLRQMDRDMCI